MIIKTTKSSFALYFAIICYLLYSLGVNADNEPLDRAPTFTVKVIPYPRQVIYKSPHPCVLDDEWSIFVESTADETTQLAAELVAQDLNEIWNQKISLRLDDKALIKSKKSIIIGILNHDKKIQDIAFRQGLVINPSFHPQGYQISVNPDWDEAGKVMIVSNTTQGIFYAVQTFRQMIIKDQISNQIIIPSVLIQDWPLFDYRGVQININPDIQIEYLKRIIHLLSFYKMNVLNLSYSSSLTGRASLGSPVGASENEQMQDWSDDKLAELIKEAKTYQINLVGNISLLEPGEQHHICLKNWCGHLGTRPLGWADLLIRQQGFIPKIPKKTIVMNTFDGASGATKKTINDYYEQIEIFRKEGLDQIICPRPFSSGYIFPDIPSVHKIISETTRAGLRHIERTHQIMGFMLCQGLNKEKIELMETIVEPIIFASECIWIPDRLDKKRFESNITHSLFGTEGTEASEIITSLSSCNELIEPVNLYEHIFSDTFKSQIHLDNPSFYDSLTQIKQITAEALNKIALLQQKAYRSKDILDVWSYIAKQWQCLADQFLQAREISRKYQSLYAKRYLYSSSPYTQRLDSSMPSKPDYSSIQKEFEIMLDKISEIRRAFGEQYKKTLLQRYSSDVTAVSKSAEVIIQDKKQAIAKAMELWRETNNLPSGEEIGLSLAKLSQRAISPSIQPPGLQIEKPFIWWNEQLNYRIQITMKNTAYRPAFGKGLLAYPLELQINFTDLFKETRPITTSTSLSQLEFDPESVRVIEYTQDGTPLSEVPYQMDKTEDFEPRFNASVLITYFIPGPIKPETTKYFCIYFDAIKTGPKIRPKLKYLDSALSGAKIQSGYYVKNDNLKIEITPLSPDTTQNALIHSWVVRNMKTGIFAGGFNLSPYQPNTGLAIFPRADNDMSLEVQANGPLLSRCKVMSKEGHSYTFSVYENLPICELFIDTRYPEYHNSYLVPKSYLKPRKGKVAGQFSYAEYFFSNYARGIIPSEQSLATFQEDTFWLAQKMVNGLTVASITPENKVTYYLKTDPIKSDISISFGVNEQQKDSKKGFYHLVLYADRTDEEISNIMNQIKNIFTLDNAPLIYRNHVERLPLPESR